MSTTCPVCGAEIPVQHVRVSFNDTFVRTVRTVCMLCRTFEDHTDPRLVAAPGMTRYGFVVILWSADSYVVGRAVRAAQANKEMQALYQLVEGGNVEAKAVATTIRELSGGRGTWRVDKDRSGLPPAIDWLIENDFHTQAESARVLLSTLDGAAVKPAGTRPA